MRTILGLIPVVNQHGTPELAAAALQRFLAEVVWFPTTLLPSTGMSSTSIDDTTARATLTDCGHSVSAGFYFEPSGAITGVTAHRYRYIDGTMQLAPWKTRVGEYTRIDGMMVPTSAIVEWETEAGPLPYWSCRRFSFIYDFEP